VSAVSGFGGRFTAHPTLNARNLNNTAAKKIIRKLILKRIVCFAKFFTFKA